MKNLFILLAATLLPLSAAAQPKLPYEAPSEDLWRDLKTETEEISMPGRARDQLRALFQQVEQTARQQATMKRVAPPVAPPKSSAGGP